MPLKEATLTTQIKRSGTSLMLNVNREAKLMGLDVGDYVIVTIRRAESIEADDKDRVAL